MGENTARLGPRPEPIAKKLVRKKEPRLLAVINQNGCTGCEACIVFCPVDCIEIVPGVGTAQFQQVVEVDIERCIGCALCAKNCPWDTIPMFNYDEGIGQAPYNTIKSVCNQKTREDVAGIPQPEVRQTA
jgi:electron transport complex protein RnfB